MRTHIPGSREGEPRGSPPRLSSQSLGLLPEGRTHGPQEGRAKATRGGGGGALRARCGPPPPPSHKLCNFGPITESLCALVSPAEKWSKITASKGNREIILPGTHQILDECWLHLDIN